MFIKVFVPNANGKIELSVQELEALLKDAADKAVREKCANCNRGYYGGITYLNTNNSNQDLDWTKVTCDNTSHITGSTTTTATSAASGTHANAEDGGVKLMYTINEMIGGKK
jgi:hypothetical protein